MKRNYQKEMDGIIDRLQAGGTVPTLLLHSCCAPCSSYVLEYLSCCFQITVLYYNPNIYPEEEYWKRVEEQKRFIRQFSEQISNRNKEEGTAYQPVGGVGKESTPRFYPIGFVEGSFEPDRFYGLVKGLEDVPEGGERCFRCYELRLREAAEYARRLGMDYFTTTLSISPLKNAERLNEIGERLAGEYGISYLCSDFKKKDGYKRSVELSKEYGMYRQDYCGCIFSKQERERQIAQTAAEDICKQ
ncbi:MAG: epoxyqueuosine reductase QueH [Lachnospiraceae bacterium]|nr:epoxyqueuosine reductase QueH [Lachnospiraceae bacterium]